MDKAALSSYKVLVAQYGTPISEDDFKNLRSYANERGIRLSGFRDFVGETQVIKTVIDDIVEIADDFPLILDSNRGIVLELDYNLGTDFATTESEHIIHLNAGYFSNLKELEREYDEAVSEGRFVNGTDWRAIARHETGHVVAELYHVDSLEIALEMLNTKSRLVVTEHLRKNLSLYSVEYSDGREIISECFSAAYGKVGNSFAEAFVRRVGKMV